ncbi:chemotaxis protein CheW [Candidatus Amarolinea dominans]|uniref:chemotaxis protein CheW n=1 Tax=Candidatus Amarolinea dominans TaxID=3140696 RepID=UPI001D833693|nr:chemotaxis protein CheW [Anaerolineae bacterium]
MHNQDAAVQLVVFEVGQRAYALRVEQVIEVLRMVAIAPLPDTPPWLAGMLNFRGQVIPVMDLRTRLGAPRPQPDLNTPIMVVTTGERMAGLIADVVREVISLPVAAVRAPDTLTGQAQVVATIARVRERLVALLDLERLLLTHALDLPLALEAAR